MINYFKLKEVGKFLPQTYTIPSNIPTIDYVFYGYKSNTIYYNFIFSYIKYRAYRTKIYFICA